MPTKTFVSGNVQRWSPRGRGLDLKALRGRQLSALALKLKSLALVLASEPKSCLGLGIQSSLPGNKELNVQSWTVCNEITDCMKSRSSLQKRLIDDVIKSAEDLCRESRGATG